MFLARLYKSQKGIEVRMVFIYSALDNIINIPWLSAVIQNNICKDLESYWKLGIFVLFLDDFIYVYQIWRIFFIRNMLYFFFRDLMGSDELIHYNHMRIFLDEDFTCPETFTVLFLCNFLLRLFHVSYPLMCVACTFKFVVYKILFY